MTMDDIFAGVMDGILSAPAAGDTMAERMASQQDHNRLSGLAIAASEAGVDLVAVLAAARGVAPEEIVLVAETGTLASVCLDLYRQAAALVTPEIDAAAYSAVRPIHAGATGFMAALDVIVQDPLAATVAVAV